MDSSLILQICEVKARRHYIISPHADRINFETQQIRAINLVGALLERKIITGKSKVAVIGAGLAGVTASAMLISYGCQVEVIERATECFSRQIKASHRFIHPSLSFWPAEPLRFTTSLPVLNWHADSCDRVVSQLRDEWENIIGGRFKTGLTFIKADVGESQVKIQLKNSRGGDTSRGPFDLIIECTGFPIESRENTQAGRTYWELSAPTSDEIVVCGSGDGALIDAIMHVFDISMQQILKIALDIEERFDRVDLIQLSENPDSFARDHEKQLEDLLPPIRRRATIVTLADDAFKPTSAPLHRMLIAFADSKQKVTIHLRSRLRRKKGKGLCIVQDGNRDEVIKGSPEIIERIGISKEPGKLLENERWTKYARQNAAVSPPVDRDKIFDMASRAIFRWIDQQPGRKPHRLELELREHDLAIRTIPPVQALPSSLFGVALVHNPPLSDDWEVPYGEE